jgi:hypothetical protein
VAAIAAGVALVVAAQLAPGRIAQAGVNAALVGLVGSALAFGIVHAVRARS